MLDGLRPSEDASSRPGGVTPGQVLAFNAPLPGLALAAAAIGGVVAVSTAPPVLRRIAMGGAIAAGYLAGASAVAAEIVFARSGLTSYRWLRDELGLHPRRWLNVTSGFDDTTGTLARLWPGSRYQAVDRFDPDVVHEAALRRARAVRPPMDLASRPGEPIPLPTGSVDAAFLLMAAHEIRDAAERDRLASEIARVLDVDGILVIVEHARDAANALAFGPGALHFHAPGTWRAFGGGRFRLAAESRRVLLVRAFVLRSAPA